jgi:hypothetical protein
VAVNWSWTTRTQTAPQDAKRINLNEGYELRYRSEKYGVSPERLRTAVRRVGVMAVDVERELGER